MSRCYKTALIGFGRIAAGYVDDPSTARWYSYATHAQVLRDHPDFNCVAVVDPSELAREAAASRWGIPITAGRLEELPNASSIEVAVIATPPSARKGLLDHLPALRAVLVEKPLGINIAEAEAFVHACNNRGIVGAVNFPRRYDCDLLKLSSGGIEQLIGKPQALFGTYGNGLRNNCSHLIDMMRMLFGSVVESKVIVGGYKFEESPIIEDSNFPFYMIMENGLTASIHPLKFSSYREVGLDIWGEKGRIQILNEGLTLLTTPVDNNRQLTGARELRYEATVRRNSSLGSALYSAYDNLSNVLGGNASLLSSLENGLSTMRIVESLMEQINDSTIC